jgi:hypothetical protein
MALLKKSKPMIMADTTTIIFTVIVLVAEVGLIISA